MYILGSPTKPRISADKNPAVGDTVTVTCSSTSTTTPGNHSLSLTYLWKIDNVVIPANSKYSFSTKKERLTVSNVSRDDANKQFTCTATEVVSEGYTSSDADSFKLNVLYGPDNIYFDTSVTKFEKRENTNLEPVTCSASCNPACSFKWNNVAKGTLISNGAVLSIERLTRSDAGTYRCTATHSDGSFRTKDLAVTVVYTTVRSLYIEGYQGEKNVTADEHTSVIQFKCFVDSNTATSITIKFKGDALITSDKTPLSYSLRDVACSDAGVYVCEASNTYNHTSHTGVSLLVTCSPRPLRQIQRNITSDLYNAVTLSFSVIAYPEPGPKGFSWHRRTREIWIPLLSNADLKISSSDLQSNLTLLNVSEEDFGQYKVIVKNEIGTYEQYMFLSERKGKQQTNEDSCMLRSDKTTIVVGTTLGAVCCVLAIFATYLFISRARLLRQVSKSAEGVAKQTTYEMPSTASRVTEGQGYDTASRITEGQGYEQAGVQYTDLCRYENSDKNTYDVIKKS